VPEGDTVWRTAQRLHQVFADQVLRRAELRWPQLSTAALTGMRTTEVVSRGKNILHRLDSGLTVHSHLRMEGQWRIQAAASATSQVLRNQQIRAVMSTAEWTALGVRLGDLHLIATAEEDVLLGHLGPDLLGGDWDQVEAARRLRADGTSIGSALLDQRNLAGVGTMYAAESLFLERVGPWRPPGGLTAEELDRLLERVHTLLDVNRHRAVPSTTGTGRHGETTYVHARSGRPCRRCGGTVRVAMVGEAPRQRTMFYCPGCQGGLGPTDDGRPQRPLGSGGQARRGP